MYYLVLFSMCPNIQNKLRKEKLVWQTVPGVCSVLAWSHLFEQNVMVARACDGGRHLFTLLYMRNRKHGEKALGWYFPRTCPTEPLSPARSHIPEFLEPLKIAQSTFFFYDSEHTLNPNLRRTHYLINILYKAEAFTDSGYSRGPG